MNEPVTTCDFCQLAPAQVSMLHYPACDACADAIAAFYRFELASLASEARHSGQSDDE